MSADLTGSHLDAATGRDDVAPAVGEGDADSDDEDEDDEDDEDNTSRPANGAASSDEVEGKAPGGDGARADGDATGAGAGTGDRGEGEGGERKTKEKPSKEISPHKLVRSFFRGLLKEWEMDLNARPDHAKRTVQGKLETKTQKQAKDYLRPLFKLCKLKVCPRNDCRASVLHCVLLMRRRISCDLGALGSTRPRPRAVCASPLCTSPTSTRDRAGMGWISCSFPHSRTTIISAVR